MLNQNIVSLLFETKAIQVSPVKNPFWYTSGNIGPYYINTHYLYGSDVEAKALLEDIEKHASESRKEFTNIIMEKVMNQYKKNPIYREVIDMLCEKAKTLDFDFISGGERRDFFFSFPVAYLLKKDHLTIFKDLDHYMVLAENNYTTLQYGDSLDLTGKNALHIADLITEASSYVRAWIPVVESTGAKMAHSLVVVDRMQGGGAVLIDHGIKPHRLLDIDPLLFKKAQEENWINEQQFECIDLFLKDPYTYAQQFVLDYPNFITEELRQGGKSQERAELFVSRFPEFFD